MGQPTPIKLRIFVEGLDHPECVAVHPDGSVWCGGEAGQIYRIDPTGTKVEEVANTSGFVLGIAFSHDLTWLAICDIRRKALLRLDLASMALTVYAENIGWWRLSIPNYPVFARDGHLFLSESGEFGKISGRIFRFDPDGRAELWAGGDLVFANGLALDSPEKYLYVVESFLPGICCYPILPDGSAGPRELFVDNLREVPDRPGPPAGNLCGRPDLPRALKLHQPCFWRTCVHHAFCLEPGALAHHGDRNGHARNASGVPSSSNNAVKPSLRPHRKVHPSIDGMCPPRSPEATSW